MNPTKTECIKTFLNTNTHADLAALYNYNMEVQLQVGQNGGRFISKESNGYTWSGWEDPITGNIWKNFRIPYSPNKDPKYTDSQMSFDLDRYVEGIGLSGWDWYNKHSLWVGFDFDGIIGHSDKHSKKLSTDELSNIETTVSNVKWVTVRRSTSGNGLHLYVFIDQTHEHRTINHCEHQALARFILGKLAGETGIDLNAKVDARGNILWIWHKKMLGTNGLTLVKQGNSLIIDNDNWREHIAVVEGKRKRILPSIIANQYPELESIFNESCSQQSVFPLDIEHRKLILWLSENGFYASWSIDQKILITHSNHLKEAFNTLKLIGIYDTLATGESGKGDYNCFCLPLRKGGWIVHRYSQGVAETDNWFQNSNGFTTTYFNKLPTFPIACRSHSGLENKKGAFVFNNGEQAIAAAKAMGITITIPEKVINRQHTLSITKQGKLVVEFVKDKTTDSPNELVGWIQDTKTWLRVYNGSLNNINEVETPNFDEIIRHLVTEDQQDSGWRIKSDGIWCVENLQHVKAVLSIHGLVGESALAVIGAAILKKWTIVNKPFESEFLENRRWNLNAAKLNFAPSTIDNPHFPYWTSIFEHLGANLTDAIKEHPWCQQNNITDGAMYLKLWVASLLQFPTRHLPFLFMFGEQNVGKSTLHDALSIIISSDGIKEANIALLSQGNFNAEMARAVLCYIEEVNLNEKGGGATVYNKLKNWITGDYITIHAKGHDPYVIPNSTHFIHVSNNMNYCPVFPNDERIVVIKIDPLKPEKLIPKEQLKEHLRKEAPDLLNYILKLQIPDSNDRLNIPIVKTHEKSIAEQSNMSLVERFVTDKLFYSPGHSIRFSTFCELFKEFLNKEDPNEMCHWTKIKIGNALPPKHQSGRSSTDNNQLHVVNISQEEPTPITLTTAPLIVKNSKIISPNGKGF